MESEPATEVENTNNFPVFENLVKFAKITKPESFKHFTKVELDTLKDEYGENISILLFVFEDGIVFSKEAIELKTEEIKENPVIKAINFSQICIYKLLINDTERNQMFINYYVDGFTKKEDLIFQFVSHKDSYCIHHLIKKYYILNWQKIIEDTILRDFQKLIYNRHYVLIKYNRLGKKQERFLIITNLLIFNVKHNFQKERLEFKKKNCQWADAIKAIKKVILIKSKEKELRLQMDKILNTSEVLSNLGKSTDLLKYKEFRDFEFFSMDERSDFIAILRMNYYNINKKYLTFELAEK